MGKSKIEWTDATWNPITGCTPISEACDHCYAKRMANRLAGRYGYPKDDPFRITFHSDRIEDPIRWKKPRRIFVCSMSDIFHADVKVGWIDYLLEVMSACPQHTFMLLTKRPQNIESKLYGEAPCRVLGGGDYLPNLWLGVTAESQARADERIPVLLQIPAAVRFVSVEPVIDRVSFRWASWVGISRNKPTDHLDGIRKLDWVIVGKETGPEARDAKPEWFHDVIDQCREAHVPVFVKKAPTGVEIIREFPTR